MATAAVLTIQGAVGLRFPTIKRMEIQSCRKIAGSSNWSQHSWGNAVDIFPKDKTQGDQIYAFLLAAKQNGLLPISVICWQDNGGCDAEAHRDHIHVAGSPRKTGVPPCASGQPTPSATKDSSTLETVRKALQFLPVLGKPGQDYVTSAVETGSAPNPFGAAADYLNPFSNLEGSGIPSLGLAPNAGIAERGATFFVGFALIVLGIILIAMELRGTAISAVVGNVTKGLAS